MFTKEEAQAKVQAWLDTLVDVDAVVCETQERPWGWMFFYQSQRFLDSGDFLAALAGNVPVYVTRADGVLHRPVAGSGVPVEEHLRLFEQRLSALGSD